MVGNRNGKKFTKEHKVKAIQQNITRKARLKKEYFKALKEEGYSVPEQPESRREVNVKKLKQDKKLEGKKKIDEKKELKRLRKKEQREKAEARRKYEEDKVKLLRQKEQDRESRKRKMTKRTKSGQPLMGPKIEDLLSKIKGDNTYTS
ncbi:rRNA-processing protein FYV7 [Nakaseomyces bracarensis]|uniref:rRNA-processing protein FYV7 n=1 Tax=Nakaseomyces bracarensis TaxID=273131 RepID=A0ABR4NLK7_9SACH